MTSDVVDSAFISFLYLYHTPAFPSLLALLVLALFTLWFSPGGLAWAVSRAARRAATAIPGPPGSLLALSRPLAHRTLAELARAHRALRLMAFSVGATRFVVSSHPETAREILNSSAFADRPVKESAYELLFHRAMGFAPFGEYWRNLRRISATHMFSPRSLAASAECRKGIGEEMAAEIAAQMESRGAVEVRRVLHFGSLGSMMTSVFGRKVDFRGGGDGLEELEALVREGYELLGMFNWSDHLPVLGWLDLQGVRKRCRSLVGKVNAYVGRIIDEHRRRRTGDADGSGRSCGGPDFVDVLLGLEEEDRLSDSDMVAVLWEMIFRGTDTVAILLEWILARMVLHPDIQAKARAEIDAVVGGGSGRAVTESDVPNFPYLQCIMKEALRMHPPGPLLSWARLATRDVHVGGHLVPAGTTAMVNMWAITHDEGVWSEPGEFRPERFMEEEERLIGVLGSDLRLAPFGSGRRVCPGKAMGMATVHLWLAQLLQRFEWVPSGTGVDLSECLKMSMEMRNPLVCRAVARC